MENYLGLKLVRAEPEERDGEPGFRVVYEDGYESWSPEKAFEAYRKVEGGIGFSIVLEGMRRGQRWARTGWNGKDSFVQLYSPRARSNRSGIGDGGSSPRHPLPYFVIAPNGVGRVPWAPNQADLLTEDWVRVVG